MLGDSFQRNCIGTEYTFILWPKQCYISGKILWLEYAYRQTAMWTGPGDPVYENRYYYKDEFLVGKIKGFL